MALSAFISLKGRIESIINNPISGVSVAEPTREILEFAHDQIQTSEEIARKMLLSCTSRLDFEIKVAVSKLLNKMYPLKNMTITITCMPRNIEIPIDQLEDLEQDIHSFTKMLKKMEAEYVEESDTAAVSSTPPFDDHRSKMVGLSDEYKDLKDKLTRATLIYRPLTIVLVGMPGIGKTTLVKEIFEDRDILTHYDLRVWVRVGRRCRLKEIPRRILAEVDRARSPPEGDDEEIAHCLRESLRGKRYLIVLDDVWNRYTACQFTLHTLHRRDKLYPFPLGRNESRVVITTRLQQERFEGHVLNMRLLNKEESWDLLREKVFSEDRSCPPQLEKAGKKIAENCKGLPLTIVTVADLLSKKEQTTQFWCNVAAKKNHQIFKDAYDEISKVLYPSYDELTHLLRFCFLYMGVFPPNLEIPLSKIIDMLNVDGFLEANAHTFQNPSAIECLDELVSNSLLMIYQSTYGLDPQVVGTHQIKTCGLHSSLGHLSRTEASRTKFCRVLSVLDDSLSIEGQSRLSFHNNVLLGIKDVRGTVENECAKSARSLLCYGPYHQYQVPTCFGLTLLRELDALTVRFYEFPKEVLELVHLKYLALTLNGNLPSSISRLSKLQFLRVDRHMNIKSSRVSSYLPLEIWDMKELKHLQVMGSDLPDPCGSLESLLTLSNATAHSCTEVVLKAIPNLRKLGIRIELVPRDGGKPFSSIDCIRHLRNLTSLKCIVVNPEVVPPLAPLSIFPPKLRKLSLSGLGYPWKEMNTIASLPLEVLKLRNYAFRGPKWEAKGDTSFRGLKSLIIEDTDLEEWTIGNESLTVLESLRIRHCYKLKKICWEYGAHWACMQSLRKIELVDCNPLGIQQMNKALPQWKREEALAVHSSWQEKKGSSRHESLSLMYIDRRHAGPHKLW